MIVIGELYILQKCKHTWNNGKVVRLTAINGEDDFVAEAVEEKSALGYPLTFGVGARNLRPIPENMERQVRKYK